MPAQLIESTISSSATPSASEMSSPVGHEAPMAGAVDITGALDDQKPSYGLSSGATGAIVVGVLLVLAAITYALWIILQNMRMGRQRRLSSPSSVMATCDNNTSMTGQAVACGDSQVMVLRNWDVHPVLIPTHARVSSQSLDSTAASANDKDSGPHVESRCAHQDTSIRTEGETGVASEPGPGASLEWISGPAWHRYPVNGYRGCRKAEEWLF
ncbi:hypothetical protein CDD82_3397 [Ophiocordyceps australis]|uniref:Uncharacterized protein n=1 Tax=Ophiocordyceps australis TaxID=1399860 RepID=A0A2C5ZCE2_9HYPO|nr:hypothetical protein CDD82_3397 [Ophiocordyceps australis]